MKTVHSACVPHITSLLNQLDVMARKILRVYLSCEILFVLMLISQITSK